MWSPVQVFVQSLAFTVSSALTQNVTAKLPQKKCSDSPYIELQNTDSDRPSTQWKNTDSDSPYTEWHSPSTQWKNTDSDSPYTEWHSKVTTEYNI